MKHGGMVRRDRGVKKLRNLPWSEIMEQMPGDPGMYGANQLEPLYHVREIATTNCFLVILAKRNQQDQAIFLGCL